MLDRLQGQPAPPASDGASPIDQEAQNKFFHWPLEFPEVFAAGGFDVLLSNPPWERVKLQEQEFFAVHDARIANAANKAERGEADQGAAGNKSDSALGLHRGVAGSRRGERDATAWWAVSAGGAGRHQHLRGVRRTGRRRSSIRTVAPG